MNHNGVKEKMRQDKNNPLSVMGSKSIHDSTYPTIEDGLNAGAKICMMFIFLKV